MKRREAIAALAMLVVAGAQAPVWAGDDFALAVHDAIKANWHAPKDLPAEEQKSLVTQVVVRVQPDGKLGKPLLRKASGNDSFDQTCMLAVEKTEKVPPPPPKLAKLYQRGVLIEFEGKQVPKPPPP